MKKEEAWKIFRQWQNFIEIHEKLRLIFSSLPESLLPYEEEVLEESLNVIAKEYFDKGDKETSKKIQEHIATLWCYESDEDALNSMQKNLDMIFKNPELQKITLEKLGEFHDSCSKFRQN